jgi:hypothetical protein
MRKVTAKLKNNRCYMRIVTFIILFLLGIALMIYRERVKRFTGSFAFAESWFGPGGTYTFFLLLGLLLCLGSIFWVTGTLDAVFGATIGRFFLSH